MSEHPLAMPHEQRVSRALAYAETLYVETALRRVTFTARPLHPGTMILLCGHRDGLAPFEIPVWACRATSLEEMRQRLVQRAVFIARELLPAGESGMLLDADAFLFAVTGARVIAP